jgi:hypothetical protein
MAVQASSVKHGIETVLSGIANPSSIAVFSRFDMEAK